MTMCNRVLSLELKLSDDVNLTYNKIDARIYLHKLIFTTFHLERYASFILEKCVGLGVLGGLVLRVGHKMLVVYFPSPKKT